MKDFFKPTKVKIILALLIPLYIGFVVEVVTVDVAGTTFDLTRESWRITPLPYAALLFGALGVIVGRENYFADLQGVSFMKASGYFFLEVILPFLITYVISCVILHFYRRLFPASAIAAANNQKELEL